VTVEMPIDADHRASQSHRGRPVPRLTDLMVQPEAVADRTSPTAAETGPGGTPGARFGISWESVSP